jgi:hypothetical protein
MFKFNLGDTVYYVQGETIHMGVVSKRTYEDISGTSVTTSISYGVVNPNNTAQYAIVQERDVMADYHAAKEVLVAQENKRHEERIQAIRAL